MGAEQSQEQNQDRGLKVSSSNILINDLRAWSSVEETSRAAAAWTSTTRMSRPTTVATLHLTPVANSHSLCAKTCKI